MADIIGNGPFSIFPSVDRQLALIEGAGIVLRGGGHPMRLVRIGEVVSFRGEDALEASLVNGPVRAWNLMVERGALDGRIRLYEGSPPVPTQLDALVSIICVLAGRYTLHAPGRDGIVLRAGDGVCLRERVDGARLSGDSTDDRVLITDIFDR